MIDGQSITKASRRQLRAMRCSIGMIFQQFNLVGNSTVQKNVLSGRLGRYGTLKSLLGLFPESDYQLIDDALKTVGLADKAQTRSDQLSGGQQQRVAIARTRVQQARIVLADEPVASLDPVTSETILTDLKRMNQDDGTRCSSASTPSLRQEIRRPDHRHAPRNGGVRRHPRPTHRRHVPPHLRGRRRREDG